MILRLNVIAAIMMTATSTFAQTPPPAIASVTKMFAEAEKSDLYLAAGDVDLVKLLPPPPKPGSKAEKEDIRAMLDIQAKRTQTQIARSLADAELSVFRFADVLGPEFNKEKVPLVARLFDRILGATFSSMNTVKEHWKRPRPFELEPRIHPNEILKEALMQKTGTVNPSYPSGHALLGVLYAIILADMVPEKADELFKRGFEYGENRSMALLHFRSDVRAGQLGASAVALALMQKPAFIKDFNAAKKELRSRIQ